MYLTPSLSWPCLVPFAEPTCSLSISPHVQGSFYTDCLQQCLLSPQEAPNREVIAVYPILSYSVLPSPLTAPHWEPAWLASISPCVRGSLWAQEDPWSQQSPEGPLLQSPVGRRAFPPFACESNERDLFPTDAATVVLKTTVGREAFPTVPTPHRKEGRG